MLLDECVDRRLAADIQGHDVKTVPEAGWAALKNSDLLSRAQHEFDALVTTDRNLPFQQDLSRFAIAVLHPARWQNAVNRQASDPHTSSLDSRD